MKICIMLNGIKYIIDNTIYMHFIMSSDLELSMEAKDKRNNISF